MAHHRNEIRAAKERPAPASNIKRVTRYLHGDSDEMSDLWPPEAEQQSEYHYVLYELPVHLDVNLDTGTAVIVGIGSYMFPPDAPEVKA